MGSKIKQQGSKPLIRKESRTFYDEYAKYDEASSQIAEANGAKPSRISCNSICRKICSRFAVATLTGDKKVVSIDFNAAVVDPEDTETLSDMTDLFKPSMLPLKKLMLQPRKNSVLSQEIAI